MSTTPRPPQIIPYLFYSNVPAALDFLSRAFGYKEEMRLVSPALSALTGAVRRRRSRLRAKAL